VRAGACDDGRPKGDALYRAEAAVTADDNTTMVMNDCNKDPGTRVPCLVKAQSIAEIEKQCLVPLDEEGTEGETR